MKPSGTKEYKKYPLSRIVSVREIVSADYIIGTYSGGHPHAHQDAWELCYCVKGGVRYFQEDGCSDLTDGDLIFAGPGVRHDSQIRDADTVSFFVSFTCADNHIQILRNRIIPVTGTQRHLLERLNDELRMAFELKDNKLRIFRFTPSKESPLGAEQMVCCYLEQILIDILREITMQDGKPVCHEHFASAVEDYLVTQIDAYIRTHLHENITVERLCREFHYGKTKISQAYKRVTGKGVHEYITELRIEQAKRLLQNGELSIIQISEQVGFSSPQYFSKTFLSKVGCSPSGFRAKAFREQA